MKNLDSLDPVVIAILGENSNIGLQSMEIFLDEVTGALVQQAKFAKCEVIEVASTLKEMFAKDGA
jgi:hypothetical protein